MDFVLGKSLSLEESLTCEFKEVKGSNPIKSITKEVDQYAVAFLNESGGSIFWGIRDEDRVVVGVGLDHGQRDELRQVIGQKLGTIAPPIPQGSYDVPFHPVITTEESSSIDSEIFVIEMQVSPKESGKLYLTGSGESYRKILGGKKKLAGAELIVALLSQLEKKQEKLTKETEYPAQQSLANFPAVEYRARHIQQLIKDSRILWVDDIPGATFYERATLASIGISVDVAMNTEEALVMLNRVCFDLIISDIKRAEDNEAGLTMLREMRARDIHIPLIFYIGRFDHTKPKPIGLFGITNLSAELFHYIFDVLERRIPDLPY